MPERSNCDSADRQQIRKSNRYLGQEVLTKHSGLAAHEQALTDFDIAGWCALFLPKGTADAIVRKPSGATVAAMETPSMRERLRISAPIWSNLNAGHQNISFIAAETKKWSGPINDSGVQL